MSFVSFLRSGEGVGTRGGVNGGLSSPSPQEERRPFQRWSSKTAGAASGSFLQPPLWRGFFQRHRVPLGERALGDVTMGW